MSESTWDEYLEAGGAEAGELEELSDVFEGRADALTAQSEMLEEMREVAEEAGDESFAGYLEQRQDAVDEAAGQLRDADWETSDAAEWTFAAETDVGAADARETEGLGHMEAAEDALAQGDLAGAEWELAMADSSFELADESMDTAGGELALATEDMEFAGDSFGEAVDLLGDSEMDAGMDVGAGAEAMDFGGGVEAMDFSADDEI